ncbi:unnamed protein product [Allacma fusca]|uniref:Transglutaminase-like domain-containing protein n=1 Tax=Allacma fusca TaxID=39272 RepID=A0A8J2LCA9_9HEXA|nr:unnamed protein product [Allacma fusca]
MNEIKAENAALRKEISAKEVPGGSQEPGTSGLKDVKTLRDVVDEIASDVKCIEAHVTAEKADQPSKDSADLPPWASHHLISKDFRHYIPRFTEEGILNVGDIDLLEDEIPMFTSIPSEADNDSEDSLLVLKDADLLYQENGRIHHTKDYDHMRRKHKLLILRRGVEFGVDFTFNRPYVKGTDSIKFVFTLEGRRTAEYSHDMSFSLDPAIGVVEMKDEKPTKWLSDWNSYFNNINESTISVQLKTPPKCSIGRWIMKLEVRSQKSKYSRWYQFSRPVYFIFNPWWSEDGAFYSREEHLDEYVLAQTGTIYVGRGDNNYGGYNIVPKTAPIKWAYEQFAPDILECALYLFTHNCPRDKPLTVIERGDVIKVARRLSSVINFDSKDSDGVLWARWNGNHDDGEPPNYWNGSKEILQQYYRTKMNHPSRVAAVKYGQCWVFAAVMTTICRALGIPARPVTNFASAHEKLENGYTFSVDEFVDKQGHDFNTNVNHKFDEIWNYHVWCEAWMQREDIGDLFNGWQVVDSMPQEFCESIYPMGPAPVKACRRGHIDLGYDVNCLFSQVNSDVIQFQWLGPKKHKFLKVVSKKRIGKYLCTKDLNSHKPEDITDTYKTKEGSFDERQSMQNALVLAGLPFNRSNLREKDQEVIFKMAMPEAVIGSVFKYEIVIKNKNPTVQHSGSVWIKVYSAPIYYRRKCLTNFKLDFIVEPGSETRLPGSVEYDQYKKFVMQDGNMQVRYFAVVNNTEITHSNIGHFSFSKLRMTINILDTRLYLTRNFTAMVTIENPLPVPLVDGMFSIHAPGCSRIQKKLPLQGPVPAGTTASVNFELKPLMPGKIDIIANFHSNSENIMTNDGIDVEIMEVEPEIDIQP